MILLLWLRGLMLHRPLRLLATMAGVGTTMALVVSLATFAARSAATMTAQALESLPVDWQVQIGSGASPGQVAQALGEVAPGAATATVRYADTGGFSATTGGTVQTTGPGKALGLDPAYRRLFPRELRLMLGSPDGVLLAQQTAANLHAGVGGTISIIRLGQPAVAVTVDGIVDLADADALFQAIGVPAAAVPPAPPDNVLLLPMDRWQALFGAQAGVRPDAVETQLHVRLGAAWPSDPERAFAMARQLANNLEARTAGSAIVGNNVAARLDGVRSDALYSRVVFVFLGLPGVILAMLLTTAIAGASGVERRREQALLRARGASTAVVIRLAAVEAVVVAAGGALLGTGLGLAGAKYLTPAGRGAAGPTALGVQPALGQGAVAAAWRLAATMSGAGTSAADQLSPPTAWVWAVGAVGLGALPALAAILGPAWRDTRSRTVAESRQAVRRDWAPWWQRGYVDLWLLAAAGAMLWRTASTGYAVVLAPEGVPQSSVSYEAFVSPLCLWLGASLLAVRLGSRLLVGGRRMLAAVLRPMVGNLAGVAAAAMARQRGRVITGLSTMALAFAFAVSTAVFDATYVAQARVDARLTNGADVAVTGITTTPPGARLAQLRALPGVAGATAMQHRFAYVGTDLQDIYGIDPATIAAATSIVNAYFGSHDAARTLSELARQPDGVLVSAETITDYQLVPGDVVQLRLQDQRTHQYNTIPFHLVDAVREFPTAPSDSFLVANASYISKVTGSDAAEIVLLRAAGDPAVVAARARALVGALPGAKVTDISQTERLIGSNLTAIDLAGLTRLELVFAVLMVALGGGLVTALALAERQRTVAVVSALGGRRRQAAAFLWGEGALMLLLGGAWGIGVGATVAAVLVTILTGVFDPPPEALTVPWAYLVLLVLAATGSTAVALLATQLLSERAVVPTLREG